MTTSMNIKTPSLLGIAVVGMAAVESLVPHLYWQSAPSRGRHMKPSSRSKLTMYFDDCERQTPDEFDSIWPTPPKYWGLSPSKEKQQAVQRLLGYNVDKSFALSVEEIEDETLQWAVESNILWDGYEENESSEEEKEDMVRPSMPSTVSSKYDFISDLIVAKDSINAAQSLSVIWRILARLVKNREINSIYMIVFPSARELWHYDVMVTLLQAVAVCKSLLPSELQNVQLDLFHPDFKHSPKMWSPESHAPFPTLGISIKSNPTEDDSLEDEEEDGLEEVRARLESLFKRIDADDTINSMVVDADESDVLRTCISWFKEIHGANSSNAVDWIFDSDKEPYALYSVLWDAIAELESESKERKKIVIVPNLDAHTTYRLAITINAALQRLDSSVRVENVMSPGSLAISRQSPFSMIQFKRAT